MLLLVSNIYIVSNSINFMKNIGVLVGYGNDYDISGKNRGTQTKIAETLNSHGYKTIKVDEAWPRDSYVFFNGKYTFRDDPDGEKNVFGEGGDIQKGDGYLLVADTAYRFKKIQEKIANSKDKEKTLIEEGKKNHNSRIHIAPTSNNSQGHIDMFTLLLPKSGILLYDTFYGKGSNDSKIYNKIANDENLKFIEYDGSQDNVWYPLNAAVLPSISSDSETILVDSNAKSLIKLLHKNNLRTIPVNLPQFEFPAGKLNCQTNTFDLKDKKKILNLFK